MLFCLTKLNVILPQLSRSSSYYTKLRFIFKSDGHLNKKEYFLDNLKTPSNFLIFLDQFEYRIENADTNIKLFLYYIVFLFTFLPEK